MRIKENIKKHLPLKDYNNIYVVADFDRTITNGASQTSWSILASSDLVPESYKEDRQKLYDKYRPIELDETMNFHKRSELMSKWFRLHIELFVKYKISEDIFKTAAKDLRKMEFRPYAKEFLEFLYQNSIPLIIISAGIGNFISEFLKNNDCYYDNIYISSNKIIFKDNIAIGVSDNIIHSLNKNEVSLPDNVKNKLVARKNVLLLGDHISDIKMVDESKHDKVIKVGFKCNDVEDYDKYFDVVITEEESYKNVLKSVFDKE